MSLASLKSTANKNVSLSSVVVVSSGADVEVVPIVTKSLNLIDVMPALSVTV